MADKLVVLFNPTQGAIELDLVGSGKAEDVTFFPPKGKCTLTLSPEQLEVVKASSINIQYK